MDLAESRNILLNRLNYTWTRLNRLNFYDNLDEPGPGLA